MQLLAATRVRVFPSNPASSQPTQYAQNIPIVVYAVPLDDEQTVLETCTGCSFVIN
jgi:hypothetical protein